MGRCYYPDGSIQPASVSFAFGFCSCACFFRMDPPVEIPAGPSHASSIHVCGSDATQSHAPKDRYAKRGRTNRAR